MLDLNRSNELLSFCSDVAHLRHSFVRCDVNERFLWQVNAGTALALRYNDASPLENHHCSVAFHILQKPQCNIVKNLSQEQFHRFRRTVIAWEPPLRTSCIVPPQFGHCAFFRCILATDMAKHQTILDSFEQIIDKFDVTNSDHRNIVSTTLNTEFMNHTRSCKHPLWNTVTSWNYMYHCYVLQGAFTRASTIHKSKNSNLSICSYFAWVEHRGWS